MTQEELHNVVRARPFLPFRVLLSNGDRFDVTHPDLVMVGRRSAVIGIANEPDADVYDRVIHVDLLHVVGYETLPSGSKPSNDSHN